MWCAGVEREGGVWGMDVEVGERKLLVLIGIGEGDGC